MFRLVGALGLFVFIKTAIERIKDELHKVCRVDGFSWKFRRRKDSSRKLAAPWINVSGETFF